MIVKRVYGIYFSFSTRMHCSSCSGYSSIQEFYVVTQASFGVDLLLLLMTDEVRTLLSLRGKSVSNLWSNYGYKQESEHQSVRLCEKSFGGQGHQGTSASSCSGASGGNRVNDHVLW